MEATEVAEVEEVEEEVVGKSSFATTPEITGTGGKTVEDFVDTYKYTKGTGKTYATMVNGKWWKEFQKESSSARAGAGPILVTTDADGKVTGPNMQPVREMLAFMTKKVETEETTAPQFKKMVKAFHRR